jgi:hypothetical protein
VSVRATLGRALLAGGHTEEALQATSAAMMGLGSGVDFAHQVLFVHSLALDSAGLDAEAEKYLDLAYRKLQSRLAGLQENQRVIALAEVPGHREIIDRWLERRPRRIEARIAAAGAPTGRPLDDDELVAVTWTVSDPSDRRIPERRAQRRHRLLRLLTEAAEQGGSPTIGDLAEALGAGVATIRRDLAALRAAGREVSTRGTRTGRKNHP